MMPQGIHPNRPQHQESLLLLATCFIVLIKNHIMIKRDEETSKSGPCSPKTRDLLFSDLDAKKEQVKGLRMRLSQSNTRHLVEVYDSLSSLSSPIRARSFILFGVCF